MRHVTAFLALLLTVTLVLPVAQAQQMSADGALRYLRDNAQALGFSDADLADLVVKDQHVSRHNGVAHFYIQQRLNGVPVYNGLISLSVARNGQVLHVGNRFATELQASARGFAPSRSAANAVEDAARSLGLTLTEPLMEESVRGGTDQDVRFSTAGIASEPITARLVYMPLNKSDLRLAWNVGLYTADAQHFWDMIIDDATGQVLFQADLVVQDQWVTTDAPGEARFLTSVREAVAGAPLFPLAPQVVPPRSAASVSSAPAYKVYAHPAESPSHTGDPELDQRTLVVNPADATASPLGWHNDGTTSYTRTRGNNVHAYTDIDANNIPDPGSDPDGGGGLLFDFPVDFLMEPSTYRDAAVTNLFYWNNLVHDIAYHYGFDEASGNFQIDTFGNGGLGGDDVRAEAQDGSGTNNANFGTPVDGFRPRMQMFVWTAASLVTVNPPSGIAGDYSARAAAFGPSLTSTGITAPVELVNDGAGASTTDACEPLVGFTPGSIALLDRGSCTFTSKVKNAQNALAVAAIVANNVAGTVTMGGVDPTITIPSVSITLDDGNLFKANLPFGAKLSRVGADRDSDFDNGVIVHEYGHGISNRLTGGAGTVSCLNNQEQMGEGWSDYFALLLTDTDTDNRGIGTYVIFEPTTGGGIRPFPYSTSFGTNPATYDDIQTLSVPHGVGFVWSTMLWDMTRALVDRHGFDTDIYSGTGGNNLALQLVMDGLKLQPCQPGFVDGRDAILAADVALTGGANECLIWDAFSNRGLGFSADQGSPFSRSDGTSAFDLPDSCCTFAILAGRVQALKDAGVLNKGQANALFSKLENAEAKINRGNINAGINQLNALINQVNAFISSGKLTAAQGQELIDCALGIISRTQQANPAARVADGADLTVAQAMAAGAGVPEHFALDQNYPNPFNPSTEIAFALPEQAHVRLVVYDVMGREVAHLVDGTLPAGYHRAQFEANRLPSGVYFYRIEAGVFSQVKQMILVK